MVLDPVNSFTGNAYQPQTDLQDSGIGRLTFNRVYNSNDHQPRALGVSWLSNYHRSLTVTSTIVTVTKSDGKLYTYALPSTGTIWLADTDVTDVLEKTLTGWRVTTRSDRVEDYDAAGRLIKISDKNGDTQSLYYNASNQLDYVEDNLARRVRFTYDTQGRVATMIDPAQRNFIYGYDANNNLASVTYPDTTTKQYLYEDTRFPNGLTGLIDERNQRYSTWAFDAQGRVIANYRPGNVDRGDIVYNSNGTTTVTNSRNTASTYSFINQFGVGLVSNITGPGCSSCGSGDSSYVYDPANSNLLSKTVKGLTTTYANYDSRGNAATITEASGTALARTSTYTYDPRFFSNVATKTEPSVCATQQKITTYTYDTFGNATSIAITGYTPSCTAVSRTTTLQYTGPLNQLSQIDGPRTDVSDLTTFTYYPNDITQGNNRGRLQRVTLANNLLARDNIQYTTTGKVQSEARPNGVTITYSYYPGNDRLQTVTQTDGTNTRATRWTYLPSGEVETITTGDGTTQPTTITFAYDAARRLTRLSDAQNNHLDYVLDTEGNREQENTYDNTNVLRRQLTQTFDLYNQLDILAQANETRDLNIAPDGTLSNQKDGKLVQTNYSYDALKRLTQTTADVGGTDVTTQNALTQYGYNVHDDLTTLTDPITGTTTFVYDDLGNVLSQQSPDTGVTNFSHDNAGNLITRQDAKGQIFNYSYDVLNRLTLLDAPGTLDDITTVYDTCINGNGRVCAITQNANTVTYSYTGLGDILNHQGVNYSYDTQGRISTLTYPSGDRVSYTHDNRGYLSQLDAVINGVSQTLASTLQYAPFGPLTQLTYGNGVTLTQTHDSAYRLIDSTVPGVLTLQNTIYDANGNLTQRADNLLSTTFTYDNLERLDTALGIFGSRDYTLDKNGNRTQLQIGATTTTYSYRPASNVMTNFNGSGVIVDAAGNTTSLRGMTLTYDTLNRLKTISGASYQYNALNQRTSKTVNGVTTNYVYGLSGELLAELDSAGGTQVQYIYRNGQPLSVIKRETTTPPLPPADIILDNDTTAATRSSNWTSGSNAQDYGANYRYTAASTTVRWHRWTPTIPKAGRYEVFTWYVTNTGNSLTAPYTIVHNGVSNVANINQRLNGGKWVSLGQHDFAANGTATQYIELTNQNGRVTADAIKLVYIPAITVPTTQTNVYYIHNDHLGTPRAMTDANKKVVWRWDSDPFGNTAANDDPDNDGVKVSMNLRFAGQYFDQESGLHYNYHRYYDPLTGRYVTSDPIGLAGGLNTFGYANANPIHYSDPYGLAAQPAPNPGPVIRPVPGTPTTFPNVGIPANRPIGPGPLWWLLPFRSNSISGDDLYFDSEGYPVGGSEEQPRPREPDRQIWPPDEKKGFWSCKARADCNDNIPGNCPDEPKRRFAFGGGVAKNLGEARNIAKSNATHNLSCQPKHVSCVCVGPKGEPYNGGC
jgi:RHS repeat-associated protein